MPVSSVVSKAMFPLVDRRNKIRSVLHVICQQAASAGIDVIGIVVSPWQTAMVREYFKAVQQSNPSSLPAVDIKYIVQTSPRGFGDAVIQTADFVGDEPFMLLLGDHVYVEDRDRPSCPAQVAKAFDSMGGVAMIGMQPVSTEELSKVGVAAGVQIKRNIYRCTDFVEKPDLLTARQRLVTNGIPSDAFLAHCGIYIFSPEIFDCLQQLSDMIKTPGKEIELAEAQNMLLKRYPNKYFLCKISGRAYDIGTPGCYANAQAAFRSGGEPL
jgi:UTP--glucose-1-phosphate uridylyltransferase